MAIRFWREAGKRLRKGMEDREWVSWGKEARKKAKKEK
jgi:hypothetical protein